MTERLTIYQPGGAYPDPHLWIEPRSLLGIRFAVFEGLVRYDAELNILPALAADWTVSDDAADWLFTLRDGVLFHDGTPVTASDAAASIRNASGKDASGALGTSALLYDYLGQAEVRAEDEKHLRITLPEPMADLPDLLVYIMIIPERCIGMAPTEIPGTGPFRFGSIDGKRYTFTRNEAYWAGAAPYDELVFVDEPSAEKRVEALRSGEADVAAHLSLADSMEIDDDVDLCVIEYDTMVAVPLMLNCFSGPFTDVRVRQAVNYGTDVDDIIQNAAGGAGLKLSGPLTLHHFGFDRYAEPYPYDPDKARELLSEAGYPDGLEVTLYRPEVTPDEAPAIAACLKEQWAQIGITLNEAVETNREQYALNVRGKQIHDLCIFDSAPVSTYRVLHEKLDSTNHGPWWQGYDSPAFNALMAEAARSVNIGERRQTYRKAIRTAAEEAPWVFLYSPVEFYGAKWDALERCPGLCQRADGVIVVR